MPGAVVMMVVMPRGMGSCAQELRKLAPPEATVEGRSRSSAMEKVMGEN
jgi:hypothetical protein